MSHSISGTNISLTRGDSLFLEIGLTENGEEYTPEDGSSLRFALKGSYEDASQVISILPISEITLGYLTDSNGNRIVDSDGKQIITVAESRI